MLTQENNLDTLAATVRVNFAVFRDPNGDRFAAAERIAQACYEALRLGVNLSFWLMNDCCVTPAAVQPLRSMCELASILTIEELFELDRIETSNLVPDDSDVDGDLDDCGTKDGAPTCDARQPRQPVDSNVAFLVGLANVTPGFDSIVGDTAVKIVQHAALVAFEAAAELPFACTGSRLEAVRSNFVYAVLLFAFGRVASFISETTHADELFASIPPNLPASAQKK